MTFDAVHEFMADGIILALIRENPTTIKPITYHGWQLDVR